MEQYLLAIRLKVNQINEIEGGTFSEPAIIATIFTGLPESFQQWVFSTTAMKPNLSDVEKQLRSIGTYKRDRANTLGSGSGTQQDPIVLQASGKAKKFKEKPPGRASAPQPKSKPKQPGNKMHIKCFGCGKMGHYKSECRSKPATSANDATSRGELTFMSGRPQIKVKGYRAILEKMIMQSSGL